MDREQKKNTFQLCGHDLIHPTKKVINDLENNVRHSFKTPTNTPDFPVWAVISKKVIYHTRNTITVVINYNELNYH